jgi:hypothetical protein
MEEVYNRRDGYYHSYGNNRNRKVTLVGRKKMFVKPGSDVIEVDL